MRLDNLRTICKIFNYNQSTLPTMTAIIIKQPQPQTIEVQLNSSENYESKNMRPSHILGS